MPLYEVTAQAVGTARLHIVAETAQEAERIALESKLVGITTAGGSSAWEIEDVVEVEDD